MIKDMPIRARLFWLLSIYFGTGVLFGIAPTANNLTISFAAIIIAYCVLLGSIIVFLPELKRTNCEKPEKRN